MLTNAERLRRASVFQRAYSARKSAACQLFILYLLPRQTRPNNGKALTQGPGKNQPAQPKLPLVGFVISKKVLRKACDRNRAKRRVREAYRNLRRGSMAGINESVEEGQNVIGTLKDWYALVWVINEKVLNADWDEICKKMTECLIKASEKYGPRDKARQDAPGR